MADDSLNDNTMASQDVLEKPSRPRLMLGNLGSATIEYDENPSTSMNAEGGLKPTDTSNKIQKIEADLMVLPEDE